MSIFNTLLSQSIKRLVKNSYRITLQKRLGLITNDPDIPKDLKVPPPQKIDCKTEENVTTIPKYGFKVKLNHKYPEKRNQDNPPRFAQFVDALPLLLRYGIYHMRHGWHGKIVVMDVFDKLTGLQIYGVPLGGIGAGTIGRGFSGEFCRFQLRPGIYEHHTVDANQFLISIKNKHGTIFQSTLSTYEKKALCAWKSLIDGSKCSYTGLYPRAWTEYDLSEYGVVLVCRQISPVIPHNYKDSSIPCSVFVWTVKNVSKEERHVTIAFTFKNGIGNEKVDKTATCSAESFSILQAEGVLLHHTIDKTPCTYALSVKAQSGIDISKCLHFDPKSDGYSIWQSLLRNGKFDQPASTKSDKVFGEKGVAIAAQTTLRPNESADIEFSLVWDMPVVTFPEKRREYLKYYTTVFGHENAVLKMVEYSFNNYNIWEKAIHDHQKEVLNDELLPDWYKSCLFNETYYISDGGTVWFTVDESEVPNMAAGDPRLKFGRFAYLEGHEYRMYNTYDVHFYASFALMMNWPMLQLVLQYDMKDFIGMEINDRVKMLSDGKRVKRKVKNTVPHDIGDPWEEPFLLVNAFPVADVSEWRDLNLKFVLQVFRDVMLASELLVDGVEKDYCKGYLEDMYATCHMVMKKSLTFDTDGDGLIENSGTADQTYDTWVMVGASAYCGGLWLAALFAMSQMAGKLGKTEDKVEYDEILERAIQAYDRKLWNGEYYNFDCSEKHFKTIMADQLCGHWYLRCCGFTYEVFPKEKITKALKTIYENNVMKFGGGRMGAVNGFIDGAIDIYTMQSEEAWTGINYALSSHMIFEGLVTEAWKTAGGMYKFLTKQIGMAYQTPEAYMEKKYHRSVGYMRPLSIWAMQLAWRNAKNRNASVTEK